ncbi:hypothetical protein O163_11475 [Caldanaerobacter subterraneus subsp. yonseiensis KB-1]|uniref:Zinc finger CHC2-type domain-containing protein n=1 Tax=Caldanaerobacter subterraneus subsp. yonseiensis KB-1 TaxID=1388761 RepID=U5CE94_CALSX|nr:DUF3854 domain-containing protein [Caldanaerobacter subterraneus]ERM91245.1 hypothetical protein O163_11475 [Caldanaerobacter subterraneus subsp. yonseiensis KB-1]
MHKSFDVLEVAEKLGIKILRKASSEEYVGRCPFCGDSENPEHGHLYLNVSKNVYYCVRCGEGGDTVDLYAKLKNIDIKEAYKELKKGNVTPLADKEKLKKVQHNPVAPIEVRDKVYRAFLDKLTLEHKHIRNLLKRGLSWEETAKNLYKTLPEEPQQRWKICRELIKEGYPLEGIPGFYQREKDGKRYWDFVDYKGFLIPVRDVQGRIQGFQIRLDEEEKGRKYVWFSSRDKLNGTPAHAWQGVHGGPSKIVIVTEGPLKADVAHYLSRYTFVSVPGVTAIRDIEIVLKQLGAKKVYIAFDMDILTNPAVQKAKERLEEQLKNAGFEVQTKIWDGRYKGIDDYLLFRTKQRKIV